MNQLTSLLRDIGSPVPPAYFVVVHERSIRFIRTKREQSFELLTVKDSTLSPTEIITEFCRKLRTDESHYGQPFAVLLDNHLAFTCIRKLASSEPALLREQLKRLQNNRCVLNYTTRQIGNASLLVAQGIDKEYLAHLTQSLETHNLPVTMITTLSSYLALYTDLTAATGPSLNLLAWSDTEYAYIGANPAGVIFSGVGTGNATMNEEIGGLRDALLPNISPDAITKFSIGSGLSKDSLPLGRLFKSGNNVDRRHSLVLKPISTSRASRAVVVAQNSLKLLLLILFALSAVSAAVALLSLTQPVADDQSVSQFQDLYTRKYSLERERDSLNERASQLPVRAGKSQNAAAMLSLFCQSKPSGLSLNTISIRRSGKDSVGVEATGTSKTEAGIFSYNQQLNALSNPIFVTIGSFRPEIVAVGGQPDTVLGFKLSMVFNEAVTDK